MDSQQWIEQLARHAGFALQLSCRGDLHIDEHHTVEDCALAIGEALRQALGDKAGIGRYGFLLAMDESEAQVAIDLSGRPYFVFTGQFGREQVGALPTKQETLAVTVTLTRLADADVVGERRPCQLRREGAAAYARCQFL